MSDKLPHGRVKSDVVSLVVVHGQLMCVNELLEQLVDLSFAAHRRDNQDIVAVTPVEATSGNGLSLKTSIKLKEEYVGQDRTNRRPLWNAEVGVVALNP
jgi:hypothetical protein